MKIEDAVAALEAVLGPTDAVNAVADMESALIAAKAERDAAVNRANALEEALARSQAAAASLADIIAKVRDDAADGVLDNPIPSDVPAPGTDVPADSAPASA